MTTSNLTVSQLGDYNTSTGVWSAAFGNIVTFGGVRQAWAQVNKDVPLVNIVSGFTVQFSPNFTETATLTIFARSVPTSEVFSATNPPNNTVILTQTTTAFAAVTATVTMPLSVGGMASTLHADMRSRQRAHSAGGHRFAIGFSWDGTGGIVGLANFALTYQPEFTGANHLRSPAGTDRAVECPRCGVALLESQLVKDEITGHMVGPECFDNKNIRPFNWPFRG